MEVAHCFRALIHKPELWIWDEPRSAFPNRSDPFGLEITRLKRRINARGFMASFRLAIHSGLKIA